ncbi:MAG: hypothetical protein ACJAQ0_001718 [Dasania sp.]|jgi:hypothetical protein
MHHAHCTTSDQIHFDTGGQLNLTAGRIAGFRSGGIRTSGYGWFATHHRLDKTYYIKSNIGVSLEKSASTHFIMNDLNISIYSDKQRFIVGRTLNAAGALHHDISDFGAPGGGTDNMPISYFFVGNFTTNVAQKLAQPFANRIAYYVKPYKNYLGLGISYAPNIDPYHPENYQFFANAVVKDEISVAANAETYFNKFFISTSVGYTQAQRQFNRFRPAGKITALQYSVQIKEKQAKPNHYRLYELNSGCLKDAQRQDCRIVVQYSKIKDQYIRNIGTHQRFNNDITNANVYSDYFIGWSWQFKSNFKVGLETILRVKEERDRPNRTDFHWLAGAQYNF